MYFKSTIFLLEIPLKKKKLTERGRREKGYKFQPSRNTEEESENR